MKRTDLLLRGGHGVQSTQQAAAGIFYILCALLLNEPSQALCSLLLLAQDFLQDVHST